MNTTFTALLLGATILTGCGAKETSGPSSKTSNESNERLEIDIDANVDGQYLAIFETLNQDITGKITGAFTFSREKETDELIGDVRLNNAGPKVIHAQNVRLGSHCPTMADDLNSDGIIDAVEGEAVFGKIFFPLDGDLSSQAGHDGVFPVGDIYGNYIYSRVTTFSEFIADLRSPQIDEEYVTLEKNEPLNIEGRAVVIHGVDEATSLPLTVNSTGRRNRTQSLPIVCGIIKKVLITPGEIQE